jgi:hypothetical protein
MSTGQEVHPDLVTTDTREWLVVDGVGGSAHGVVGGWPIRRMHAWLHATHDHGDVVPRCSLSKARAPRSRPLRSRHAPHRNGVDRASLGLLVAASRPGNSAPRTLLLERSVHDPATTLVVGYRHLGGRGAPASESADRGPQSDAINAEPRPTEGGAGIPPGCIGSAVRADPHLLAPGDVRPQPFGGAASPWAQAAEDRKVVVPALDCDLRMATPQWSWFRPRGTAICFPGRGSAHLRNPGLLWPCSPPDQRGAVRPVWRAPFGAPTSRPGRQRGPRGRRAGASVFAAGGGRRSMDSASRGRRSRPRAPRPAHDARPFPSAVGRPRRFVLCPAWFPCGRSRVGQIFEARSRLPRRRAASFLAPGASQSGTRIPAIAGCPPRQLLARRSGTSHPRYLHGSRHPSVLRGGTRGRESSRWRRTPGRRGRQVGRSGTRSGIALSRWRRWRGSSAARRTRRSSGLGPPARSVLNPDLLGRPGTLPTPCLRVGR